jgi:antitoxin CcdA
VFIHAEPRVRDTPYELRAAKQTVSLTLNSDLYAKAKALGINVSQVAEQAVADAYTRLRAETLAREIAADLAAAAAYADQHGAFADHVRAHYGQGETTLAPGSEYARGHDPV